MATSIVTCRACDRDFQSPIQFGTAETLNQSVLVGNRVECPHCGQMVPLDKQDIHLTEETES